MIHTDRLLLRPHQVADLERYLPLWHQAETRGPGPELSLSAEDVWARLLRFVGHWSHFGYGLFIVEELSSGDLVGEVGFAQFHRGVGERFDSAPEAAWRILASRRKHGIAGEAMQAAIVWLEQTLRSERTVCMIHPGNTPSLNVATRLGYLEFARAPYKGWSVVLLERPSGQVSAE
jgi:RimJ/RimL family protein N-acetyltransferase